VNVIDPDIFFDSLRDVAMATNYMAKFVYIHLLSTAAFENGLPYCHIDSKIFRGNILATSHASSMKIGPVTPDIARVTMHLFG